jgi:hypothetical protein
VLVPCIISYSSHCARLRNRWPPKVSRYVFVLIYQLALLVPPSTISGRYYRICLPALILIALPSQSCFGLCYLESPWSLQPYCHFSPLFCIRVCLLAGKLPAFSFQTVCCGDWSCFGERLSRDRHGRQHRLSFQPKETGKRLI